jgi:thiol-disulfide isomerase/thioredoxin
MTSARLFDRLLEEGIICEKSDSNVALSDEVIREADELLPVDSTSAVSDSTDLFGGTEAAKQAVRVTAESSPELLAYLTVLDRMLGSPEFDFEKLVGLLTLLAQVTPPLPRTEGAPAAFTPVNGDHISLLTDLYERVVLYVWLEDCEPCDMARDNWNEVVDEAPEGVAMFSIFGPDSPETLYQQFGVGGGPVTLFVLNDEVDCRIYGASYPEPFENELNMLQEL